jgi:hypothetical protein
MLGFRLGVQVRVLGFRVVTCPLRAASHRGLTPGEVSVFR